MDSQNIELNNKLIYVLVHTNKTAPDKTSTVTQSTEAREKMDLYLK